MKRVRSIVASIVCVALVKIRHVRPYKRRLIVEVQQDSIVA